MTRVARVGLVVGVLALGACSDDASTLERADEALARLESGRVEIRFEARVPDQEGTVGFAVDGVFDVRSDGAYPLLDMSYTRFVGTADDAVAVRSDGSRVAVETSDGAVVLTDDQAATLRLSDAPDESVVGRMGLDDWVDESTEREGDDGSRIVTGPADVPAVLDDVTTLLRQMLGESEVAPVDAAAGDRIRSLVRASEVEVVVGEDDVPRSTRVHIEFGGAVPPEVRDALGPYAGVVLDVTMTVDEPGATFPAPELGS